MTPLATPRRLRRHGRVVALTTAAAALVGVAGASTAFQVDQRGTAAAAVAAEVVPVHQAAAPALVPALPDLDLVGERIAEDLRRAVAPPAVVDAGTGLLPALGDVEPDQLLGAIPELLPVVPPAGDDPAADPPTPASDLVGSLPLSPLLHPDAPLPVDDALAPVLDAADDALGAVPLLPTLVDEAVPGVEGLPDPLGPALDEPAALLDPLLDPLLEPRSTGLLGR